MDSLALIPSLLQKKDQRSTINYSPLSDIIDIGKPYKRKTSLISISTIFSIEVLYLLDI